MSSVLSPRAQSIGRRVLAQLARVATNVLLAYGWGGLSALILIAFAERLDPEVTGVFGLFGSWVWTMSWLLVGSPLVVITLALLDLALYKARLRRRIGLAVSLMPGVITAGFAFSEPALVGIAIWLTLTGLAFGLTMRLPFPSTPEASVR